MITREEIAAETAGSLSETEQYLWLALFREYPGYSVVRYPGIEGNLATVQGVKAKQLLAALRKIEEIGSETSRIEGGRSGLDVDPVRDRNALVGYALGVLYDKSTSGIPTLFATASARRRY